MKDRWLFVFHKKLLNGFGWNVIGYNLEVDAAQITNRYVQKLTTVMPFGMVIIVG